MGETQEPQFQARIYVLRRWNSFTPVLPVADSGPGGGYFLHWTPDGKTWKGIAVDPGFDFLANFQGQGLPFNAIDAVVLTHSHVDHIRDFEAILTAKYERCETIADRELTEAQKTRNQPLRLYLSLDAFRKLAPLIDSQKPATLAIGEIRVLTPGTTIELPDDYGLHIDVLQALHGSNDDPWLQHAVSLLFRFSCGGHTRTVGLTSDTRFESRQADRYQGCDVVIGHLGEVPLIEIAALGRLGISPEFKAFYRVWQRNIAPRQIYKGNEPHTLSWLSGATGTDGDDELKRLLRASRANAKQSSHLQLGGIYEIFRRALAGSAKLAIVSEFGLELGSLRHKVADALNVAFFDNPDGTSEQRVITGDIGLVVSLESSDSECSRFADGSCEARDGAGAVCSDPHTRGVAIQCTKCHEFFPIHCPKDVCIRYRDQAMVYNCPTCLEHEFSPPQPLIPYSYTKLED